MLEQVEVGALLWESSWENSLPRHSCLVSLSWSLSLCTLRTGRHPLLTGASGGLGVREIVGRRRPGGPPVYPTLEPTSFSPFCPVSWAEASSCLGRDGLCPKSVGPS